MRATLLLLALLSAYLPTVALAGDGWQLLGSQGIMYLVAVDKSEATNQDVYRFAVAHLCAGKSICQVLFWIAGTDAPRSLPMTDAQVASQVAHWQYNGDTGLRRFLWSCTIFPDTTKDECF